jgi:hypothetical protein
MRETEITEFLSWLARQGKVAASTQNQALSALLFLYKEVLKQEIGWLDGRARKKACKTARGTHEVGGGQSSVPAARSEQVDGAATLWQRTAIDAGVKGFASRGHVHDTGFEKIPKLRP